MSPKRNKKRGEAAPPESYDIPRPSKPLPIIKVVGISGGGKSTLVRALRADGYDARPVSQEHSNVPDLWQRFDRPSYLLYLFASLEDQERRRQDVSWSAKAHQEEMERLRHAREHADLRINTGELEPHEVYAVVISFLKLRRVRHAHQPLAPIQATGSAKMPTPDGES